MNQNSNLKNEIYGSFFLNESEFAVSVSHIQEVVNPPLYYTNMPLAPFYLVGLFNLRGTIIPVVNLQILMAMPKSETQSGDQKIAILELEDFCIGILFDKTSEIFRSHSEERFDFLEKSGNSVVSGVFKKDAGKRLIQILDVQKLFELQSLPKQSQVQGHSSRRKKVQKGLKKQCISFRVGLSQCALGIHEIQEILKVESIHETALASRDCIGTLDLRGCVVPVFDFAALLKYREPDTSKEATHGDRRVVVMKIDEELFGLLVDSVDSILSYHEEELKPFPVLNPQRAEMFRGYISIEDEKDILLLDHLKMLTEEEISQVTRGHSQLYKNTSQHKDLKGSSAKRTFITFVVDATYAIPIQEVSEIIEYPKELLHPPGLPLHCKGMLNLRGNIITIVDTRKLYENMGEGSITHPKVLIFKKSDLHFGLVVDSVEGIVSFSDQDKIKLPELLYRGASMDIAEAIQYKDSHNHDKNMLILSSESIVQRLRTSA